MTTELKRGCSLEELRFRGMNLVQSGVGQSNKGMRRLGSMVLRAVVNGRIGVHAVERDALGVVDRRSVGGN